jgi:hypothetical protein
MRINVWREIRDFAKARGIDTIDTTLLGSVPVGVDSDGRYVSHIREGLAAEAKKNGFVIVGADFKRDCYTLRRLPEVKNTELPAQRMRRFDE